MVDCWTNPILVCDAGAENKFKTIGAMSDKLHFVGHGKKQNESGLIE